MDALATPSISSCYIFQCFQGKYLFLVQIYTTNCPGCPSLLLQSHIRRCLHSFMVQIMYTLRNQSLLCDQNSVWLCRFLSIDSIGVLLSSLQLFGAHSCPGVLGKKAIAKATGTYTHSHFHKESPSQSQKGELWQFSLSKKKERKTKNQIQISSLKPQNYAKYVICFVTPFKELSRPYQIEKLSIYFPEDTANNL